MKKYSSFIILLCLPLTLLSWSIDGRRAIAKDAEGDLTVQAKQAIRGLLGKQTLEDVANWADEVLSQPPYKNTASWHFLYLPMGLNNDTFFKAVINQHGSNLYTALLKCESDLSGKTATKAQKIDALKFIVSLIVDANQPMHVSNIHDKDGSLTKITFCGKPTNLRDLWDTGMLDHQKESSFKGYTYVNNPRHLKPSIALKDNLMETLFASYRASSQAFADVKVNNNLGEEYYQAHLDDIVEARVSASIELAGTLNFIFKNEHVKGVPDNFETNPKNESRNIDATNAVNHIGEAVCVTTKVFNLKNNGNTVALCLGAAYPNQSLTVILTGDAKSKAKGLNGKTVSVIGMLRAYKGKAQMEISDTSKIKVIPVNVDHNSYIRAD